MVRQCRFKWKCNKNLGEQSYKALHDRASARFVFGVAYNPVDIHHQYPWAVDTSKSCFREATELRVDCLGDNLTATCEPDAFAAVLSADEESGRDQLRRHLHLLAH